MAVYEALMNLVDRLIAEKEKNFILQQQMQQLQQEKQKKNSNK